MNYTEIDGLIEKDESLELYELQCEIINSETLTDNEKLLRLAIMQTNCPVDDWENAAEILRNYVPELHGEALLIAVYIAVHKIENPKWTYASRAYVDRETNEVVLYAQYKHHTDKNYRIPIKD